MSCVARDVAVFASATESFARRNLNCGLREALDVFKPVVRAAKDAGIGVRGYISMCFGDPWEGRLSGQSAAGGRGAIDHGLRSVEPRRHHRGGYRGRVVDVLDRMVNAGIDSQYLAVHFHDTYGQALADSLAAIEWGVTTVDASAGGLGGCPFAGTATGNLATEDLCWALDGLGVHTGVDLNALVSTSLWMAGRLGRPSPVSRCTGLRVGRRSNGLVHCQGCARRAWFERIAGASDSLALDSY